MKGKSIYLRPFEEKDVKALTDFQIRNRLFFEKFSMLRENTFYTEKAQLERINQFKSDRELDLGYHFGIFKNEDGELVGTITLFHVIRGSLQSAIVGYFLDQTHNGMGYTTEAVKLLVKHSFEELKLHRLEAGVMPHNIGSIRVLEKAGFHKEGIAKKNVLINGKWEDHQVLAIINPADS
ncbi:GNAT family N-acetyltransferase [Jeotgalibacillus campisalis]|uniref:Alanine acetyltransferase n=1 Tax=Jeotgalibacillus campisalis TaxID=220754 RepID=A0A0C2SAZ1_9BACL|nr:GNAT family protein [Jeotgalibacillus campisalis]KIL51109.1 alanine acetyltransferase [Jeotgalibacillus campisalis]